MNDQPKPVERGECRACHNRSIPIENGLIASHPNPNPFLSVVCLGTARPPVRRKKGKDDE